MSNLSAFSLDAKLFAIISKDNRLQLWDTDTFQEKRSFVERQHLSHSYVSHAWFQSSVDDMGSFVVGTTDGMIIMWDLVRGVVAKTIGPISNLLPSSIAFSLYSPSIFVASNTSDVFEYDINTGNQVSAQVFGKKGPLKLCMSPLGSFLVAASSSVRILEFKTGKKRKLNASFPGGVTCLSFTQCGEILACAGCGSREIILFNALDGGATNKDSIFTIATDGICISIQCQSILVMGKKYVNMLAIYEDLNACIMRCCIEDNTVDICRITCVGSVLGGVFVSPKSAKLACGRQSHPTFETVVFESNMGTFIEEVTLVNSDSNSTSNSVSATASSKGSGKRKVDDMDTATVVLGPHEIGAKRAVLDRDQSLSMALGNNLHTAGEGVDGEITAQDAAMVAEAELTLEARLDALSASMLQAEMETAKVLEAPLKTSTESMVVLLDQALQSGDDSLLEQCLGCPDADVVEATASRLPVGKVLLFLRRVVAKFEKRPSRGILLTRWLTAVLKHHTSFLVSVPDLANHLAGLSQMLEHRLSSYTRLASLGGRLDLLMSQISTSSTSRDGLEPVQVYIDE